MRPASHSRRLVPLTRCEHNGRDININIYIHLLFPARSQKLRTFIIFSSDIAGNAYAHEVLTTLQLLSGSPCVATGLQVKSYVSIKLLRRPLLIARVAAGTQWSNLISPLRIADAT